MSKQLKLVRSTSKLSHSYDGHRRRFGDEFVVAADANESWFVQVGPAPQGAELPTQIQNGQAQPAKSFVDVMQQLGKETVPPSTALPTTPITLDEGAKSLPVMAPVAVDNDLVG